MAVIHTPIPDKSTPWENYGGQEVEDFIKQQLDLKMGTFYYDTSNNRYLVFADETNRDLYLSDPVAYSSLLIATFDAPFNYTATIELVDTPSVKYLALGATGTYIKADFDVVNKQGASMGENVNVTVTFRNGSATQKYIRSVTYGTQFELNIDQYLSEGDNVITIAIVGQNTLAATTVGLTYHVINLQISDTFDISQIFTSTSRLDVPFTVSGSGVKRVEWFIDGEQLPYDSSTDDVIMQTESKVKNISLADLSLGSGRHNLQVRAYVEPTTGTKFYSDILFRDFIIRNEGYFYDIVATAFSFPSSYGIIEDPFDEPIPLYGAVQYNSKEVKYAVYTPFNTSSIEISLGSKTTAYTVAMGNVYSYEIKSFSSGNTALNFEYGETELTFNAAIGSSPYTDLREITSGLVFAMSGQDRTNASSNRNTWSYGSFTGSLSGFLWNERSGWTEEGLLMPEGASFSVSNYLPLNTEPATNGATFEFEFETRRVKDDNTVICDLRKNGVGLVITASEASFTSRGGVTVNTKYKSGESLRVSFVVNGANAGRMANLVQIYIDGINAGTINFPQGDSFASNASLAFAGSDDATLLLKYIRCYSRPLSADEILNNFILYRHTTEQLVAAYDRNDIIDNGQPSSDKLSANTPIIIITGDVDTLMSFTSKSTYLRMDKIEVINNQDPTRNMTLINPSMRCQGTSSMNYPIKNFRFYTQADNKDGTTYVTQMFDYQGNELTGKERLYSFKEGAQPVKCWCLKADYAESSSTHNTSIARLWNEVMKNAEMANADIDSRHYVLEHYPNTTHPCRTLAQHAVENNPSFPYDVRTTVDGFPITLFYHKTEGAPLICLGKYNWNNDKSTESVYGFVDIPGFDDENVECWEMVNGDYDCNQFIDVSHWTDTTGNKGWRASFESRYPDDSGESTEAERAEGTGSALKRVATWLADHNGSPDDPELLAEFVEDKWDYLDVYKLAAYYVYLMRFGAVDQTVKNGMWTTEDGLHWFYINYDNDTILGLVNSGLLRLGYEFDRQSPDPSDPSGYAYAGHESTLWNNLEADTEFMGIVKVVDQALFNAGLTYTRVIDMFNNQQSAKWSERLHNYDYTFKYINSWVDKGINHLQMLQGPRRTHREWWLSHRFAIWDGINGTGQFRGSYIEIRPNQDTARSTDLIKMTPAVSGQMIGWGHGKVGAAPTDIRQGTAGTEMTFNLYDNGMTWYIGDYLYPYNVVYVSKVDFSAISRVIDRIDFSHVNSDVFESELTEIILGSATSDTNMRLTSAQLSNIGAVKYLERFTMRSYVRVQSVDFSQNLYLKHIDLRGCEPTSITIEGQTEQTTGITLVTLPEAAPIESIYFPSSIQRIVMKDLADLSTLSLAQNGPNVIEINARNCKVLTESAAWLNTWITGKSDSFLAGCTVTLDGIDWGNTDINTLINFGKIGNLTFRGKIVTTFSNVQSEAQEQVEALQAVYGPHCFESSNDLWITSPTALTFFTGPDEVLEGNSAVYALVVIGKAGTTEYSVTGSRPGVSIQSRTGELITTLNNQPDSNISVTAVFTENETYETIVKSKMVTIRKETYPSANDIVISGESTIRSTNPEYTAVVGGSYTGIVSHTWSVEGDISNYYAIKSAPVDQIKCTLECIDRTYILSSGSVRLTLKNRLGTTVANKDFSISVVSANIAVARATNAPIMDAFWNAYGTNGTIQAGVLDNENYITKTQAAQFTGTMLNPTGGQTTSIFYPQRGNITHFEEFEHFIGVTEIPVGCFNGCQMLASILLPEDVQSIGGRAFNGCSFPSINVNNVKTCDDAFYNCGLVTLSLPNLVEFTGSSAFSGCDNLKELSIPKYTGPNQCFYNNYGNIGSTKLTKLTVGSLEFLSLNINTNAAHCGLGDNCTVVLSSICDATYTRYIQRINPIGEFQVESGNPYIEIRGGCVVEKSTGKLIIAPNNAAVTISNTVTSIGDYAFRLCTSLSSVTIPSSVTTIGESAFRETALQNLVIPQGVTSIGNDAFYGCYELQHIVILGSATLVGRWAFYGASKIHTAGPVGGGYDLEFGYTTKILGNLFTGWFDGSGANEQNLPGLEELVLPSTMADLSEISCLANKNIKTIYCYAAVAPSTNTTYRSTFGHSSNNYTGRNTYD